MGCLSIEGGHLLGGVPVLACTKEQEGGTRYDGRSVEASASLPFLPCSPFLPSSCDECPFPGSHPTIPAFRLTTLLLMQSSRTSALVLLAPSVGSPVLLCPNFWTRRSPKWFSPQYRLYRSPLPLMLHVSPCRTGEGGGGGGALASSLLGCRRRCRASACYSPSLILSATRSRSPLPAPACTLQNTNHKPQTIPLCVSCWCRARP